jgi:hypothetical protein
MPYLTFVESDAQGGYDRRRSDLWLWADQDMDHVRVGDVGLGIYLGRYVFRIERRSQTLSGIQKLGVFVCVHVDYYKSVAADIGLHAAVTPTDLDPARCFECESKGPEASLGQCH